MGQLFCLARSLEFVGRIPISIIISTGGSLGHYESRGGAFSVLHGLRGD